MPVPLGAGEFGCENFGLGGWVMKGLTPEGVSYREK